MTRASLASRPTPRNIDRDLAEEQIRLLLAAQAFVIKSNCLFAIMTTAMIASRTNAVFMGTWIAATLLYNGARLTLARRLLGVEPRRARVIICVSAFFAGILWALLPLEIGFAGSSGAVLVFTICVVISGATLLGTLCGPLVLSFVGPIVLSIIVKALVAGDVPRMFALSVLLYACFIVRGAFNSERRFMTSARLCADAEAAAEGLAYVAAHDALTGLMNRAEFCTRLEHWLERSRDAQFAFALYLLDIDNFKVINDSLGHGSGDEVLCEVAQRLIDSVGPDDVVARLGGDEFAILIAGDTSLMRQRADKLLAAVCQPAQVAATLVPVGASLGIAIAPRDGLLAKDLLVAADLALYAAKEAGRQCWRCFDETLRAKMAVRSDIERDLPAALADGALDVWFQPQVALHSSRLIGLEALVRWQHPRHGFVAPTEIVAAALRLRISRQFTGLIVARACAMVETLERRGFADVEVAVNVSPREFDLYDVAALIGQTIKAAGIAPHKIEVEITEEALVEGEKAVRDVARLAELGVRLAIDDFGAGCASIAYLRYLKVDRIKIDRSFIRDFADRAGDRVLVQAIIGIGRALGVEVVAEGVETAEDAVLLAGLGCHLAQGYFFGLPMTERDLIPWLDNHRKGYAPGEGRLSIKGAVA